MSFLSGMMHTISDHGNALASKTLTYFGVASVGGGGALGIANETAAKLAQPEVWTIQDWAAIVSIVGGVCLIIKTLTDVYFNYLDRKSK